MRILLISTLVFFASQNLAYGQVPQSINYQAIARDGSGQILANQKITLQMSILDSAISGNLLYKEQHNDTTNALGLFTLLIGKGNPITGNFNTVNWSGKNGKFLKVEMDPLGGSNFVYMGTMQLVTVPFAFFSDRSKVADSTNKISKAIQINPSTMSSGGASNGQILVWNGTAWVPTWVDSTVSVDSTLKGSGTYLAPLGIAQRGAKIGQTLIWNGTTWLPGNIVVFDGDSSIQNELQNLSASKTGNKIKINISKGNSIEFSVADADSSVSNEIQTLMKVGGRIILSQNGGTIYLNDSSSTNELQVISKSGNWVTLSKGGGGFSVADEDSNSSNEIQNLSIKNDTIFLSKGGFVKLPAEVDGSTTNEIQYISISNDTIFLTKGGFAKLPAGQADNQLLSIKSGVLSIQRGNSITLPDTSASNELQTLSRNNDTLFLSNGGYVKIPYGDFSWSTKGNAGTGTSNFLGTTDAKDLYFRLNNKLAGRLFSSNGNIAFGDSALGKFTSGTDNIAMGNRALYLANNGGIHNIAMGYHAMYSNYDGDDNTAVGYEALYSNTTGIHNLGMGFQTLTSNTTGSANLAIGYGVLRSNTKGDHNIAFGQDALSANTTGKENFVVGRSALFSNKTGYYNIGFGTNALYSTQKGYYNIGIGYNSLYFDTSGGNNIGIGLSAGYYTKTGENNTSLGVNTYNSLQAAYNNTTALGYQASVAGSNRVYLGNTSVTGIYAQVTSISSLSDGRVKENISEDVPGIDFIMKLRPVSYNLNIHKQNKFIYDSVQNASFWKEKFDIEKIRFNGLIAQEVEKVMNETGAKFTGLEKPNQNDPLYHIKYGDLIMPLVKSIQEQQRIIDLQTKEIETLKSQVGLLLMKK